MFNAVNGLGAGGQVNKDKSIASTMNACVYAFFAIVGFMAGGIVNIVGPRITIFLSGWTYVIYIAAFYHYSFTQNGTFNIIAGILLGIGAGCIWTAQGALMMSYPKEDSKGRYVAIFWAIFNTGGVVGSLISLAINAGSNTVAPITSSTYITFIVITAVGTTCAIFLLPPNWVRRKDGSRAVLVKHPNWIKESIEIFKLVTNKKLMLLFPMFWYSNWFYAYQFGINEAYFSTRARSLNGMLYWFAQIIASILFGRLLDYERFTRRTRAFIGLVAVFVSLVAVFGGGTAWQLTFSEPNVGVDWTDPRFPGPMINYMLYGFCDAMYQVYCYWLMGALTNDPQKLARYAGFYKGVQSAGAAVTWAMGGKITMMNELIVNWALLIFSVIPAFFVCQGITETNYGAEEYDLELKKQLELEKLGELPKSEDDKLEQGKTEVPDLSDKIEESSPAQEQAQVQKQGEEEEEEKK
ncbi:uncharacterized protein VTP21DRAFT_1850 [Calcarisporiella thermophila]|uniref:uncharacterized protein n=1 Tax=Calcarisporiella thermophila TaxID=911321 RepID=UPI00374401EA